MATFGPLEIPAGETWEIQAVCLGQDGSVIYSNSFFASNQGATTACQITSQPTSTAGPAGTTVNLGGTATGGIQWQTSQTPSGPWVNSSAPSSIQAGSGTTYWRFCCVDNPAVCSTVATVTETTNNFTTSGSTILDPSGNPVSGGGWNGSLNVRTS